MKSLGNLLRKYISENGLTIYKAASLAGVNRTTLQKVLSDERNASEELIQKLLSVLKLSPAEKAERHCPQCGAEVEEDALFCHRCGAQL